MRCGAHEGLGQRGKGIKAQYEVQKAGEVVKRQLLWVSLGTMAVFGEEDVKHSAVVGGGREGVPGRSPPP